MKKNVSNIAQCMFCLNEDCYINNKHNKGVWSAQVCCPECGATGPKICDMITEEDAIYCAIDKWNNLP